MSDEKPPQDDSNRIVEPPPIPRLSLVGRDAQPVLRPAFRPNPQVRHDHNIDLTAEQARDVIRHHPQVYQRNERLVEIMNGRIRDLTVAQIRARLTSAINFMKRDGRASASEKAKLVNTVPSDHVVHFLADMGDWGARPLSGVTTTPLVRRDGTIQQDPGYDPETRFVYAPKGNFPRVPDSPSRDECLAQLSTVIAPISSFPWKTIGNKSPSLSAYVALLLTSLLVGTIEGNIPGFVISANVRGTGKSKLTQIASLVASGEVAPTTPFARDDDEVRKSIVGLLKKGRRIIMWDNVVRKISGESLDMLLTTRLYEDRELGKSINPEYENNSISIFTGNNLEAEGDTVRRLVPIDIHCDDPQPEKRVFDFDPLKMVREDRAEIVSALLTIIRGWYIAGCPRDNTVTMGSYEEWSGIVPQILIWLGISNPLLTREHSSVVVDRSLLEARELADLWTSIEVALGAPTGITMIQTMRYLYPEKGEATTQRATELRFSLETLLGEVGRDRVTKALMYRLRMARGRCLDDEGRTLDCDGVTHGNKRWSVKRR